MPVRFWQRCTVTFSRIEHEIRRLSNLIGGKDNLSGSLMLMEELAKLHKTTLVHHKCYDVGEVTEFFIYTRFIICFTWRWGHGWAIRTLCKTVYLAIFVSLC